MGTAFEHGKKRRTYSQTPFTRNEGSNLMSGHNNFNMKRFFCQ